MLPRLTSPWLPAPMVEKVSRIPGTARSSPDTWSKRAVVVLMSVPVGSSIETSRAPWSVSGKNSIRIKGLSAKAPTRVSAATSRVTPRCARAQARSLRYRASTRPKKPSTARENREWCSVCPASMRADRDGVSVKATNSDTATAKATVMPNWKKKRPTRPFMVATGTNTATIDAVVARTASPISEVASMAACMGFLPICRCRLIDSITTMASSIRMPIDSESASMVMLLNVKFMSFMNPNDATTDVGRARALMKVARQSRRNRKMMRIASRAP